MKKHTYLFLFIIILILFCSSCHETKKDELFHIKDYYEERMPLVLAYQTKKWPTENRELIYKKDNEIKDYPNIYNKFGDSLKAMVGNTINETQFSWFILEFESIEAASESIQLYSIVDGIFQYKNCLFSGDVGRMLFIYDVLQADGCDYVNDYKILIDCNDVDKIKLKDTTEFIEVAAGRLCTNLETVYCNKKLKYILDYAFADATNLTHVYLEDNLIMINMYAFYNTNLEYIVIPDSVEYIGSKAFSRGLIFCEADTKPPYWEDDFAIGKTKVYYAGEWEYNSEGIPTPIIDKEI